MITRISNNAFTNLAVSMIGFGVAIGLVFPFAVLLVGVPGTTALRPWFFAFTVIAGVLVGSFNILLARLLVRPRLRLMARRMAEVEDGLRAATYSGDWSKCDPAECSIPVESDDEFGDAASAFNRLLSALSDSHKVEERIAAFTDAMSSVLDVGAICEAAIDAFRRDLGAAGVAIIGDGGGSLCVLASHGLADPSTLVESDLVRKAIRSLSPDSMNVPEHLVIDAAVATLTPRHVIVYPLVIDSRAIGAVVLASSVEVPAGAQSLAPLFIRTLSVALSNALSHQSMRHLAASDALTGVLNRGAGLERLRSAYQRSLAVDAPLAVVMADIDHFKVVNDTHGHLAGDRVLRAVSDSMKRVLRDDDFLVRYGGEEFLIVLPGAAGDDVATIAERLRSEAGRCVVRCEGVEVRVTISLAFASTSDSRVSTEMGLVEAADHALYEAKDTGRNRVVRAA